MGRIGIITGVRTEATALSSILNGQNPPLVRFSGANAAAAGDAAEDLVAAGVEGLLSFGTAGGLAPDAAPGTLIVADRVMTSIGDVLLTDSAWTASLSHALQIEPVTMFGADAVANVAAKREMQALSGAVAVDMESHAVGRAAAKAGLPFAVLRAVADPIDFEIPGWLLGTIRADGSLDVPRLIFGVIRDPRSVPGLIQLGRHTGKAKDALRGAVGSLGPGLGLLPL